MNVSDTLNLAADLIEERGWVSGPKGMMAGSDGLCLQGAILAASSLTLDDVKGHGLANSCPAGVAVRRYLDLPVPYFALNGPASARRPLWWWNDAADTTGQRLRTATEVVEVLRATALIEAARERETAAVTR